MSECIAIIGSADCLVSGILPIGITLSRWALSHQKGQNERSTKASRIMYW